MRQPSTKKAFFTFVYRELLSYEQTPFEAAVQLHNRCSRLDQQRELVDFIKRQLVINEFNYPDNMIEFLRQVITHFERLHFEAGLEK